MMKNKITLILHDECHNTSSENCNKFLLKAKEYNIQQALLHNIDPKNEDVIYFNHHFGQAMFYWSFGFDKTWYRNSATFHLEGGPEYL